MSLFDTKGYKDAMKQRIFKLYDFGRFLVNRFFEDRCTQHAGSLTYTTLFAVVPILTIIFVMLAGIPAFQEYGEQILQLITKNFVSSAGDTVSEYLLGFSAQARNLTWIGIVFLLITTFMMLVTIESAFNSIWRIQKPRYGLQRFLLYWALLSLGPLLLGVAFAASTYVMSLSLISGPDAIPGIANFLKYMPFFASIGAFTFFYAAVPNTKVPIRHAFISGFFTALLLEVARTLFAFYVKNFPGYQLIYGAFAAVPLFLFWLYISWVIVLLGCELCCCLGLRHYLSRRDVPTLIVALGVLRVFYEKQQKGDVVTYQDIQGMGWYLPEENWTELLTFFRTENLICDIDEGASWVLCRDVHQYPFVQFISHSPWPLPRPEQLAIQGDEPWLKAFHAVLVKMVAAQETVFQGSLATWLTVSKVEGLSTPSVLMIKQDL